MQKSDPQEYERLKAYLVSADRNHDGDTIKQEDKAADTWTVVDPDGKAVEDATGITGYDAIDKMLALGGGRNTPGRKAACPRLGTR